MFGEKLYFKRFIYVSIKIVYFYGIHKSSLPFFFFASWTAILSLFIFKELSELFNYYYFWCRDDFIDILLLNQNLFFHYVYNVRVVHTTGFQRVCMDD